MGLVLGLFPLILLLLAFIFILITLILVGSYLSRDMMEIVRLSNTSKYIWITKNKKYGFYFHYKDPRKFSLRFKTSKFLFLF
jgi:hypothetical protein